MSEPLFAASPQFIAFEPQGISHIVTEHDDTTQPSIDYAARRAERAAQRASARTTQRPKVPWPIIITVVAVLAAFGIVEAVATTGRIHPGVAVAGVDVGGMVPEKAHAVLARKLPALVTEPVVVAYKDSTWEVTASDINLSFDYDRVVAEAMAVGRTGGPFTRIGQRVGAWTGGTSVSPTPVADTTATDKVLDKIADKTDVAPVDATVDVDGTDLKVVPAASGVALQREVARQVILGAMLAEKRTVQAPVAVDPVAVTDEEAEQARKTAQVMIAKPLTVTYKKKQWEFSRKELGSWLEFVRSDEASGSGDAVTTAANDTQNVTLVVRVSPKKAGKTVVPRVGEKIGRPAKDARFKTNDGSVTIVPSQTGIGPDMEDLAAQLDRALVTTEGARVAVLKTTVSQPKITTEDARKMGINERISKFTTTYSPGNKPRVNNIHTLGDALDGTLIAPGKTFSFNGVVGERTAAKGYQEANAIVDGKLVPQLGGGICQVGTTVFNAAFKSGLPITQRRNHSFYISHYPKGRDATISWGGPDLKFKNTTDDWILVSVSYTSGSITVALYGTDPGYEVESTTSEWRNVKKFPVEEVKDPDMKKGVRVVEDPGVEGKSCTVERTVSKDGKVVRTDKFVSVYRPKVEVVRVGTKVVEEPKKTTTDKADNQNQ